MSGKLQEILTSRTFPGLITPKLPKHYDWAHCRHISDRHERDKLDAKEGIVRVSESEMRRKRNKPRRKRQGVSYAGQVCRRSSAEKA